MRHGTELARNKPKAGYLITSLLKTGHVVFRRIIKATVYVACIATFRANNEEAQDRSMTSKFNEINDAIQQIGDTRPISCNGAEARNATAATDQVQIAGLEWQPQVS